MKVTELTGPLLDYWVAKADEVDFDAEDRNNELYRVWEITGPYTHQREIYSPSTDWSQGGAIIEKNNISINQCWNDGLPSEGQYATKAQIPFIDGKLNYDTWAYGSTYLIAAMRCFVSSKFGEEVPDDEPIAPK